MLVDELKKANIEALKTKDVEGRNILGVVLNKVKLLEISKRGSDVEMTDADVVQILMKTVKELEEEKENYVKVGNAERIDAISRQTATVERFLPKLMSENEIAEIIASLPDKSIPFVMKHFKANYAGKCDMKVVQRLAAK